MIDKYFDTHGGHRFLARTARAICSNCVVLLECRTEALHMAYLPERGTIGGVSVTEIRRARAWRGYELGLRDRPSNHPRPAWLEMTEATNAVEHVRLDEDPDEPAEEGNFRGGTFN